MANQKPHEDSLQFLENKSLDSDVRPKIMRRGMLGRDSTGVWRNLLVESDGSPALSTGAATSANQPIPFTTYVSTTVTLTDANTAYKLPSSEQSGRKSLTIVNNSDTNIYIGSSSVTTSTGILLNPNDVLVIKAESGVYAVCGTNSKTVNCLESK